MTSIPFADYVTEFHVSSTARVLFPGLLIAPLLAALVGCSTPDLTARPSISPPAAWAADIVTREAHGDEKDEAWWTVLRSAELDRLIEHALQENRSLRAGEAQVAQAFAGINAAGADAAPQVGLALGYRKGRSSSADPKASALDAGFRASWEIDPFGGIGLASDAAHREANAAEGILKASRISLAGNVANAYVDARALSQRLRIAGDDLRLLDQMHEVTRRRFDAGQSTRLDEDRLDAELQLARSSIADLEGALQTRIRQLAVMCGRTSSDDSLRFEDATLTQHEVTAPYLPATLLERRPDVQAKAKAVEAAIARLGVARRDIYPRFELSWAGRRERLKIEGESAVPSVVIGYGLSVTMPLLDGGAVRANISAKDAAARQAMAEYEQAMLAALADAEIALHSLRTAGSSVQALERAERAAGQAVTRSQRLFQSAALDLGSVLDARRQQLKAHDALIQAQAAHWQAEIAVRRAFAGAV
jgi:NodT family efflux transporter outer membrane factor (OMF) lipoprotein